MAEEKYLTQGDDNYANGVTSFIPGAYVSDYIMGTIYALGGNDTIHNDVSFATIFGGLGDDYIYNRGDWVFLAGDDGNDTIESSGKRSTVTGGNGADAIYRHSSRPLASPYLNGGATIDGGAGNDTIINPNFDSVDGGAGDDVIQTDDLSFNTIKGGTGNDTIDNTGYSQQLYQYADGDGNDVIYGFNNTDTLHITKGDFTVSSKGKDMVVHVGNGSVTLKDGRSKFVTIIDYWDHAKTYTPVIEGTSGKDDLSNTVAGAEIDGLAGNDNISNTGANVTIYGGAGNDLITNAGANVIIHAGTGNDTIKNTGSPVIYQYVAGDGNDVIGGFGTNDTLQISGEAYSTSWSGEDMVVKIGNGSVTLKYVAGQEIHIDGKKEEDTPAGVTYNAKKTTLTVKSPFKGTLDARKYASTVKTVNASSDKNKVNIYGNAKANTIRAGKGGGTLWGGAGNDTLYGGAGKDIFRYATGEGNDVFVNYTPGKDTIRLTKGTITKASASGSNTVLTVGKGKMTVKGMVGKAVNVVNASKKTISYLVGKVSTKNKLTGTANASYLLGGSKADTLMGGKGNDTLSGGKGNDILTGGAGSDIFQYATGDGKDTIKDYTAGKDKIQLTNGTIKSYSVKGKDVVLNIGTGSVTIKNIKGKNITIIDAKGKESTYNFTIGTNEKLSTATAKNAASLIGEGSMLTAETVSAEKLTDAAAALAPVGGSLAPSTGANASNLLTGTEPVQQDQSILIAGAGR